MKRLRYAWIDVPLVLLSVAALIPILYAVAALFAAAVADWYWPPR